MRFSILFLIALCFTACLNADRGKVILKNGNSLEGMVNRLHDGSCWVGISTGLIKFDKSEIKKIIITKRSKKKTVPKLPRNNALPEKHLTYDEMINYSAKKHNLDPALIKAVMKTESDFNPYDTSHKGACGLMQLMPETAKCLGVKNIYEPRENIDAGSRYLKEMLCTFNGDLEKALAAYNAGPAAVRKYNNNVPPYRETRSYIRKVYSNYNMYRGYKKMYTFTDDSGCLNIYNLK